jgi:SAM-dependent methyltransferase
MDNSEPGPAVSAVIVAIHDLLRSAVAAYLARFKGQSRIHTQSDLRGYLTWCVERRLDRPQKLRGTFDSVADLYQQARPEYPPQLFDTLVEVAGLQPGSRLLEVGCATGKATLPLARRGYRIPCIEIGPDLAAAARANLTDLQQVDVVEGDFETWEPPAGDLFDLAFAAIAGHWLDSSVRYQRAWRLLRYDGGRAVAQQCGQGA